MLNVWRKAHKAEPIDLRGTRQAFLILDGTDIQTAPIGFPEIAERVRMR